MKVHEMMSAPVRCVAPDNTLVEAAGLMRRLDVGAVPVCDGDRLLGMLTDRDIAIRAVADGRDPNTTLVQDVMSPGIVSVDAQLEVEAAVRLMRDKQVRRLPVINRARKIVGIVALGDIAVASQPAFSGMTLRDVSESQQTLARHRGNGVAQGIPATRPSSAASASTQAGGNGARHDGDGGGADAEPPAKSRLRSSSRGKSSARRARGGATKQRRGGARKAIKRRSRS